MRAVSQQTVLCALCNRPWRIDALLDITSLYFPRLGQPPLAVMFKIILLIYFNKGITLIVFVGQTF
jgi:hypothetical protein